MAALPFVHPEKPGHTVWLYLSAWTPAIPLFGLTHFLGRGDAGWAAVGLSATVALADTLAAAALGYGACLVTRRLRWPRRWSAVPAFVAAHGALALTYGLVWNVASRLATALLTEGALRAGVLAPDRFWWWGTLVGVLLYHGLVAATYAYTAGLDASLRGRALRAAEADLVRAEADRAEAELAALRAHLNPHFFFNTLHALSALVREDPRQAERAVEAFGDLFRYTLRNDRERRTLVRLSEELDFARTYLDLEALRFADRLQVAWHVDDDALDALVPPLLVQALVENAVRHGIAPLEEGGALSVVVEVTETANGSDVLAIEVADDGAGADPADASGGDDRPGYGLRGLRRTLVHVYGSCASLDVRTRPGEGFTACLRLPLTLQPPDAPVLVSPRAVPVPVATSAPAITP